MTTTLKDFARKFIRRPVMRPPAPVQTQEAAYSSIFSMYDEPHGPSRRLIDLSLAAVEAALTISLSPVGRDDAERKRLDCFPGEPYRFIAGLSRTMRPGLVTYLGADGTLTHRVLREEGLNVARLDLNAAGLADPKSELILLDGPKDGASEERAVRALRGIAFTAAPLLLIDGTRHYEMIPLWRSLDLPKMDLTTFAHWSGTLAVELARPH